MSTTFLPSLLVSLIQPVWELVFVLLETFPLLYSFLTLEPFNYLVAVIGKFYLVLASKLITFFFYGVLELSLFCLYPIACLKIKEYPTAYWQLLKVLSGLARVLWALVLKATERLLWQPCLDHSCSLAWSCLGCLFGYSLLACRVTSGFINGEDRQISPSLPVPALAM